MTYRESIEAMKREWRDRKVEYDGKIYSVLDVDYNGALLIDKPDEFKATTAVSVGMVKLLDGIGEAGGGAPMNPFAKAIRQQLLEYQQQLAAAWAGQGLLRRQRPDQRLQARLGDVLEPFIRRHDVLRCVRRSSVLTRRA